VKERGALAVPPAAGGWVGWWVGIRRARLILRPLSLLEHPITCSPSLPHSLFPIARRLTILARGDSRLWEVGTARGGCWGPPWPAPGGRRAHGQGRLVPVAALGARVVPQRLLSICCPHTFVHKIRLVLSLEFQLESSTLTSLGTWSWPIIIISTHRQKTIMHIVWCDRTDMSLPPSPLSSTPSPEETGSCAAFS
jgi:hypothetical protein